MKSIGRVLDANKGFGPGYDFLRVFLALSVVTWHAGDHTGHLAAMRSSPAWIAEDTLLPMFFVLSGFLVTASGIRLSLGNFLINRGLRIVPALAVEIAFSALIVGPMFTTFSAGRYFSDPLFFHYFTNMIGWINWVLPGVFQSHPVSVVNEALWTVPYEIGCYAIMSGLILSGALRSPLTVALFLFQFIAVGVLAQHVGLPQLTPRSVVAIVNLVFVSYQSRLLVSFLLGVLAYQLRHAIPYLKSLFFFGVGLLVVLTFTKSISAMNDTVLRALTLPVLTYLAIFIGATRIVLPIYSRGDYSYGIYLYHCPIEQMLYSLFHPTAVVLLILTVPSISLFAMFSWHCIEKPILNLRKRFSFVARQRGVPADEPDPQPN